MTARAALLGLAIFAVAVFGLRAGYLMPVLMPMPRRLP